MTTLSRSPRRSGGGPETVDPVAGMVRAAADGDVAAWAVLVDQFSPLVWSIGRSYRLNVADAADVSQVVWMRLVEHLDTIRQPEALGAWLASVTRHECLRMLRKADREVATDADLQVVQESHEDEVDQRLLAPDRDRALWRAFETLPDRWQALLRILISSPTASYEDASAALGMPVGSIGPTRQRCLERLRNSPELSGLALTG